MKVPTPENSVQHLKESALVRRRFEYLEKRTETNAALKWNNKFLNAS